MTYTAEQLREWADNYEKTPGAGNAIPNQLRAHADLLDWKARIEAAQGGDVRDAIKTLRSPVEISQAYCAVIADLLEALSAKLAERERRAAERERAERLMERLQQESERCDKEVSQRIWADTELQRERERADRNQEDAERYRWLRQYPIYLRMWAWTEKLLEKLDAAIDAARRK